jgi:hypothetical protein
LRKPVTFNADFEALAAVISCPPPLARTTECVGR